MYARSSNNLFHLREIRCITYVAAVREIRTRGVRMRDMFIDDVEEAYVYVDRIGKKANVKICGSGWLIVKFENDVALSIPFSKYVYIRVVRRVERVRLRGVERAQEEGASAA